MAKLERKTQKIFSSLNPTKLGVFGSAQALAPATSLDLDVLQSAAYEQGWTDATIGGNKRPPLEEFNAIKYINDYQNAYVLQEGIPEYDVGTTYFINSIVKQEITGILYKSVTDDNIGNALTDISNWVLYTDISVNERTVILDSAIISSDGRVLVDATSGNITITLPAITAAFKNKSDILIKRVDSSLNTVTIVGTDNNYEDEGLTLDNTPPFDLTRVFASNSNIWRSA